VRPAYSLAGLALLLGMGTQLDAGGSGSGTTRTVEPDIPPSSYWAGSKGRGLLKYLVRCALEGNTEARLALPGETLHFQGGVGLAQAWIERPLTNREQRWVSACLFALTNELGKTVRVDLRGTHPLLERVAAEDTRDYSLHEGGFFGNAFLAAPVAYVCTGAAHEAIARLPIGEVRRCARPSGEVSSLGQPLSRCGFIITGSCSSPSSFVVDGERFDEVVHVWLPPLPRN
jgi:hypothetical protein